MCRIADEYQPPSDVSTPEEISRLEQRVWEDRARSTRIATSLSATISPIGPYLDRAACEEERELGTANGDATSMEEGAWDQELSQEELEIRQAERELEELVGDEATAYFPCQDEPDQPNRKKSRDILQVIRSGKLFGGLTEIPTNPTVDPPYGTCLNCWGRNHQVWKCPFPLSLFCRNCGRKNLMILNCPRCEEPFRRIVSRALEDPIPGDFVDIAGSSSRRQLSSEQVSEISQLSVQSSANLLQELRELEQLLKGLPTDVVREAKMSFLKERL